VTHRFPFRRYHCFVAKRRIGIPERRFHLSVGARSRLTNSKRTFYKADWDGCTKRLGYIHCGSSSRARFSPGLGPLSTRRVLPFFAFARASSSRYTLVRASRRRDDELLLSRKTTSPPFPSRAHTHTHATAITNHQAERNYFALLTRSLRDSHFHRKRSVSDRSNGNFEDSRFVRKAAVA